MLPIAATSADGGAACFDRESGAFQPDRLRPHNVPPDTKVLNVWFSPDGKSLILDCQGGDQSWLLSIKLKLSAEELEQLKSPPAPAVPADPPPVHPTPTGQRT